MSSNKGVTKELVAQAKENLSPLRHAEAMSWLERTEPQLHALMNRCSAKVAETLQKLGHDKEVASSVCDSVERSTIIAIESLRLCYMFCDGGIPETGSSDKTKTENHGEAIQNLPEALQSPQADEQESEADWLGDDEALIRRMSSDQVMRGLDQVEPESASYLKKNLPRILQPLHATDASEDVIVQLRQNIMRMLAVTILIHRQQYYALCHQLTGGMAFPEIDRALQCWRKARKAEERKRGL